MKKLLFCISALFAAVACTESTEDGLILDNTGAVSFEATMTTRATDTAFEVNDEISVMASDSDGNAYAQNVLYTYGGSIFSSDAPIVKLSSDQELSYLAVYPYTSISDDKKVSFSVKEDQSIDNNYTLSDLLSGSISATNSITPQFVFNHLLSKLVINIDSSATTDDAVAILNALTDIEYDLTNSSYTTSGEAKTITMASEGEKSFKALLVPQVIAANSVFGSLTVGGTNYEFTFTSDINILSGYAYTFTATIVGDQITFSNAIINDWNVVELKEDEAEEPEEDTDVIVFNDSAFESYLLTLGIDSDDDGVITVEEAELYTGSMVLASDSGITDITEIKYFTNMTTLNSSACSTLKEIDLTYNTVMKSAQMNNTAITSVVLPGGAEGCSTLTGLYIQTIPVITELDLSVYPSLYSLYCGSAVLSSVNVTGCSSLKTFCITQSSSELTSLDLSTNSAITALSFNSNSYVTKLDISNTAISQCSGLVFKGTSAVEELTLSAAQAAIDTDNDYATWVAMLADSSTGVVYIANYAAIWENGALVKSTSDEDIPTEPTMVAGTDSDFDKIASATYVSNVSDEFNGTALDITKWCADPSANGWAWLGAADGLFQEERAQVVDGNLTIEVGAFPEPVKATSYGVENEYNYYCALVRSLATGGPGHYYECRMKMNKTELGGGFWLMAHPDLSRRHEIDVQECVGVLTQLYDPTSYTEYSTINFKDWANIFHSNAIYTKPDDTDTDIPSGEAKKQGATVLTTKNSDDYMVYGFWWKGVRELRFYLNGEYQYTLNPNMDFDVSSHVQMSIQVYDWNLVPEDGGQVTSASVEDRTTYFDWVRVWKIEE
ncbi:MAG: fimbrillin family protein [Rikenellaceae bacterium]